MTLPLTPEAVLVAYRHGIFPMAESREGSVGWYSPALRGILPLDRLHVPRSLARVIRSGRFEVASDRDVRGVIDGCADRTSTWISTEIGDVYAELHRRGHVHTVEAYRGGRLVGGIYGVHIGAAFMGESMFHRERDAGKACLVALAEHLRNRGFLLFDIQEVTPITERFGGVYIPHAEYLRRLKRTLRKTAVWGTLRDRAETG